MENNVNMNKNNNGNNNSSPNKAGSMYNNFDRGLKMV
jgi:hypothetical protein